MKPLFKYHVEVELEEGKVLLSWGVCPIIETAILDGVYDPSTKTLKLLVNSIRDRYVPMEVPPKSGKGPAKVEMRKIQDYYRLSIPEEDIKAFLDLYVDNNFEYTPPSSIEVVEVAEPKLEAELS